MKTKKSKHNYDNVDIKDEEMFKIMGSCVSLIEKHNYTAIQTPIIIFMGDQGTGKTQTLDRLAGQKMGLYRRGTDDQNLPKTISPIYHNHKYVEGELFSVSGYIKGLNNDISNGQSIQKGIKEEDLPNVTSNILQQADAHIKNQGGLSACVYVSLNITGPTLKNMHFVDLPGMSHNNVQHATYNEHINKIINKFSTMYKHAVFVFVTTATNIGGSSLWHQIRNHKDKSSIIWVITRPDSLNQNDVRLKAALESHNDLSCGIPKSNIFIVKNYDSTNKTEVKDEEYDERNYFQSHPIYSELLRDPNYSKQFGISNLRSFVYSKVRECMRAELPALQNYLKNERKLCEIKQKAILVAPIPSEQTIKGYTVQDIFRSYLECLRKTFKGDSGFSNDNVLTIRNIISIDFCCEIRNIPYNVGIDDITIMKECARAGGIENSIGGFSRETFLNLMFDRDGSPYKMMIDIIHNYIDKLDTICRDIINSIKLPEMEYIDNRFWDYLRMHLQSVVKKKALVNAVESFCIIQRHNYKNYLKTDSEENVNKRTTAVMILSDFWKDVKENVCTNFPKYVAEFLIEENLRRISESRKDCHQELIDLFSEKSDILVLRQELADRLEHINEILNEIKTLRRKV